MTDTVICLWYDDSAEAAVARYGEVFDDVEILGVTRYPEGSYGGQDGKVMTVDFTLGGRKFIALNGGPHFKFTEAISVQVLVEDQEELDRYWDGLLADGGTPSQCGWLKDPWGLSWQITPANLPLFLGNSDPAVAARVNAEMLTMSKIDIATLEAAARAR